MSGQVRPGAPGGAAYFPACTPITVRRYAGCGCLHARRTYLPSEQPSRCQRHGTHVEKEWQTVQEKRNYTHLGRGYPYRIGFQTAKEHAA